LKENEEVKEEAFND